MKSPRTTTYRLLYSVALFAVGCLLSLFFCASALSLRQNKRARLRAADLPVTVKNAEPIIAGITRYTREKGKPPPTLAAIVPRYVAKLTNPGPAAKGGWDYYPRAHSASTGWALAIRVRDEYSPNILGFGDTFVYHSSGQYDPAAYGGGLRRFGRWGYYVE